MAPQPRLAQEIIDQAIEDNRAGELLLYLFAGVWFAVGVAVVGWSLFENQPLGMIGGAAVGWLVWPAMKYAKRFRKENTMIRLLEVPLSRADTAKEACEALAELARTLLAEGKDGARVEAAGSVPRSPS